MFCGNYVQKLGKMVWVFEGSDKNYTKIYESGLGVREEEAPALQRGGSAAGHTPLRTLDSTPALPLRSQGLSSTTVATVIIYSEAMTV